MDFWNRFNQESLEKHYQIFWIEHYLPVLIKLYYLICVVIIIFIIYDMVTDISEGRKRREVHILDQTRYQFVTQTNAQTYHLITKYSCYIVGLIGGQPLVADFYYDPFQHFTCFGFMETKTTYEVSPPRSSRGSLRGGRLKYYYKTIIVICTAAVLALKMGSNYFNWEVKHYELLWESEILKASMSNVSTSSNFSMVTHTVYNQVQEDVSLMQWDFG